MAAMTNCDLTGQSLLIVEGPMLSTAELADSFREHHADVRIAPDLPSAFQALEQSIPNAVILDFTVCQMASAFLAELAALDIPYVYCGGPNRLQRSAVKAASAENVAKAIDALLHDND